MSEAEWAVLKSAFNENLEKYTRAFGKNAESPNFLERVATKKKWHDLERLNYKNGGSIWQTW